MVGVRVREIEGREIRRPHVDLEIAHPNPVRSTEHETRLRGPVLEAQRLERHLPEIEGRMRSAEIELEVERDASRKSDAKLAVTAAAGRPARSSIPRLDAERDAALFYVVAVQGHGARLVVPQMHRIQERLTRASHIHSSGVVLHFDALWERVVELTRDVNAAPERRALRLRH